MYYYFLHILSCREFVSAVLTSFHTHIPRCFSTCVWLLFTAHLTISFIMFTCITFITITFTSLSFLPSFVQHHEDYHYYHHLVNNNYFIYLVSLLKHLQINCAISIIHYIHTKSHTFICITFIDTVIRHFTNRYIITVRNNLLIYNMKHVHYYSFT